MNFIDIAKKRYSCRSFQEKKIEQEKLDQILEAARIAPTGANRQPQVLIVVQKEEALKKLEKATNTYKAPLAIIVCCDTLKTWTRPFDGKMLTDIDASIVTDHMMLQATDLDLGSVWIANFKADSVRAEFGLPNNLDIISILLIGYNAGKVESPDRHATTRNPIESIVRYNHF